MKTTLQKVIELLDSQISVVENSKKGKDAKYKFGADAAITNLVVAKIKFKGMIQEEREQIENAFVAGSERGTKDIPFNCEQYYSQTFGDVG